MYQNRCLFQEREVKLPSGEKSCVLHKCYPGTNHFLRVYAMSKDDRILDASTQLTVQTAAPPDTPLVTQRWGQYHHVPRATYPTVTFTPNSTNYSLSESLPKKPWLQRLLTFAPEILRCILKSIQRLTVLSVHFRACNFKYVAIEWEKPKCYGDAKITGYKVYVNGVVEAILSADQQTYSFTHGRWCREYAFQVQVNLNLSYNFQFIIEDLISYLISTGDIFHIKRFHFRH